MAGTDAPIAGHMGHGPNEEGGSTPRIKRADRPAVCLSAIKLACCGPGRPWLALAGHGRAWLAVASHGWPWRAIFCFGLFVFLHNEDDACE